MKRLPRLAVAIAFLLASTPLFAAPDAKSAKPTAPQNPDTGFLATADGFRGIKFGTLFSSLSGFQLDKDQGPVKLYTRKGDKLDLGPVKLEAVVYYFFNGKFYGASLHTKDQTNSELLRRVAQTLFGNGSSPNESQEFWKGKKLSAIYSINLDTQSAVLILQDYALENEKEAYLSKASEEALKDL